MSWPGRAESSTERTAEKISRGISHFPVSSALRYHKARPALGIPAHFSTPGASEIQDFQVEKGRWALLCTPDIIKHKALHRGEEKELGKLIPKRPQRYLELWKAAGWSISRWTGLSVGIIVIIYYITSRIAAFSIHPQPPPAALTLSLCSYVVLVFFYLGKYRGTISEAAEYLLYPAVSPSHLSYYAITAGVGSCVFYFVT